MLPVNETIAFGEPTRNYALRDYEVGPPVTDQFHSANLLYETFRAADVGRPAAALCRASRDEFGRSGTAWGVKHSPGRRLSWELYYYQHSERREPQRTLSTARLLRLLDQWGIPTETVKTSEAKRFSLSFDLDEEVLLGEAATVVHEYVDQGISTPPSAMSYRLTSEGPVLENAYTLCRQDPPALNDPRTWVFTSLMFDPDLVHVDDILWPEMLSCDHLALAHKPTCDGVYFGGVSITQLEAFLRRTNFNPIVGDFVVANRHQMQHLRFDVGFDFIGSPDTGVTILKAAVYGVL